ncbi:MAG: type II secretion system F family protein [Jatrophihabitantaceae bacterium]
MPGLTLTLLGAGLLVAPAPVLAQRRLTWLAATRWAAPADLGPFTRTGWAAAWQSLAQQALAHRWLGAAVAAVSAGMAVSVAAGPVLGLLVAVTGLGLTGCARLLSAERDSARRRAELAAIVTVLQNEYTAGATIGAAFTAAAVVSGRFRAAVDRAAALARDGHEVAAALRTEQNLAPLAIACDLAGRSGASLARSLAGVQADLTADQRTYRAVRTALAGPRSSALLLSGLPLVGLAMGAAMGAHPQRVLTHTGIGRLVLAVGVVLDLAGLAWTLALSRRVLNGRAPGGRASGGRAPGGRASG